MRPSSSGTRSRFERWFPITDYRSGWMWRPGEYLTKEILTARPPSSATTTPPFAADIAAPDPVARGDRLSDGALRHARRRQMPQPAEQRPSDFSGGEPGFECLDRAEIGASGRQPHRRALRLLIVLVPRQEEHDAVFMPGQVLVVLLFGTNPLSRMAKIAHDGQTTGPRRRRSQPQHRGRGEHQPGPAPRSSGARPPVDRGLR